jgi:succinate dehydrogenase/fumarate reductase flavoprotein subunit
VTGSRELTGDGVAMAYRAGAELADMEFITFACNIIYWPSCYRGSILTYIIGYLLGGQLENCDGERVFPKYDPWMIDYANSTEWNKSFISLISALEMRTGKTLPHGGLRFTQGAIPLPEFEEVVTGYYPDWVLHDASFIGLRDQFRRGEGVEVGPAAEYFEGGISVNERYETSIPGLYAAGECAVSVFGANRVAAATMEMLTTGARAGWSAGEYTQKNGTPEVDAAREKEMIGKRLAILAKHDGLKPSALRIEFQEQSHQKMSPVRNVGEVQTYLTYLDDLKMNKIPALSVPTSSPVYNKAWIEALDLANMVDVMEASARAALERTESRGVHYREDYPNVDNDNWLQQVIVRKKGEEMQLVRRPVPITSMQPPSGVTPHIDFVRTMMQAHSDVGGHH